MNSIAPSYFTVTVSVDSLGWTKHWLRAKRCDLLTVDIASKPSLSPRVRITAVESKSKTGEEPIELSARTPPFDEAIEQVAATLSALNEFLLVDTGDSVIADIKLAALFEYLASESLAQLAPVLSGEDWKLGVFDGLSALSKRELNIDSGDIELSGLAVVTQRDSNVDTVRTKVPVSDGGKWDIELIRCGIPALRKMLEAEGLSSIASRAFAHDNDQSSGEPTGTGETGKEQRVARRSQTGSIESENRSDRDLSSQVSRNGQSGESERDGNESPGGSHGSLSLSTATRELLTSLETACRLRRFPIESIDENLAQEGPTLVSVPVALRAGEKIAPIEVAGDDLARELGVRAIGVENHPTRPYFIRFLLPRADRQFPAVPDPPERSEAGQYLPLWLGAQVDGAPYLSHVSEWPHLLVAGTTGSGKTTFMRSLLVQIDRTADDSQVVIVDGKGEFDYFDLISQSRLAERFPEVLLGHEKVIPVLDWLVNEEVNARRAALLEYFQANPSVPRAPRQAYTFAKENGADFPTYPLVVFVDEFAELMLSSGADAREFEDLVQRVVQAGRSALVHLVLATQRPDANVLRGAIKANLPSRVALALPSHHDSMIVLNASGAQQLLGHGDLIFQPSTVTRVRLQGFMPPL